MSNPRDPETAAVHSAHHRRFAVEEVDNGWLVKVSAAGSDKLLARYVFTSIADLLMFLRDTLNTPGKT